jgi:hypothetical protein
MDQMTDMLRTSRAAKSSLRTVSRAALGCVLGATLLAAATPARAADDSLPIDRKIFRGLLEGLGLQKDVEAPINYEERAPLVIPPSRALPPPERSDAALAKNPAWPKDPDVVRRKVEAEQERNRNISEEREHEQNPLRPDELTPGPRPKSKQARTDDGYQSSPYGYSNPLLPSQLGYNGNFFGLFGGKKDDNVANFTKEPPRTALTEPPPGYQTPSPDQPYGLSKKTTARKATNYLEEHGTLEGGR